MPNLTPEERARIARANGAKSQGPKTPEGKAASSRNAIKTGEHASKLGVYTPHSSVLSNEDRQEFYSLVDELLQIYVPANQLAQDIVNSIAQARWQIGRLQLCLTLKWQFTMVEVVQQPQPAIPELIESHVMATVADALYSGNAIRNINREIRDLHSHIARLERRLRFVNINFPSVAEPQPVEKEEVPLTPAADENENEPIIYITENSPRVVEAYRATYPGRKIVVLAPDNVAKGIEEPDDMPVAPRKTS